MAIIKPSQKTYTQDVPPEWVAVEQAAKLLEEMCLGIGGQLGRSDIEEPSGQSTYAEDSKFGGELAKVLHAKACDLILIAIDQGRALARCIEHTPLTLAGYTCARAILESCSTASWLVDSKDEVTAEERFRRFFDFTLTGPVNARRLLNRPEHRESLDIPENEVDQLFNSDKRKVLMQSDKLGVEPRKCEGTLRIPIFSDNPRASVLADMYFPNGAVRYRRYSAIAHCDSGAIENEWLVKADPDNCYKFMYQSKRAFSLIRNVMTWILRTYRRLIEYTGECIRDIDDTIEYYVCNLSLLSEQVGIVPDLSE